MDFSLGLRLGPQNKKAIYQEPPPSSVRGPPTTSPCLSCPPSACACPCPSCPPPPCSCTACPSDAAATCPSCPGLPGPPCTCSCPPCPACPPSTCPHTYCVLCSSPSTTCCRPSPCPTYSCSGGHCLSTTACRSSRLGCSSSCSCGRGVAWGPRGSTGCCSVCFRRQRAASRGLCQII
ncbi:uncharacterized LOC122455340 homolog [Rattus norvegicus]|uniref:uncharacterized LOC122455340 homolog n=1 Tax=Rattus norvegicus TaxID=10116 RepID=UPI0000DBFA03